MAKINAVLWKQNYWWVLNGWNVHSSLLSKDSVLTFASNTPYNGIKDQIPTKIFLMYVEPAWLLTTTLNLVYIKKKKKSKNMNCAVCTVLSKIVLTLD